MDEQPQQPLTEENLKVQSERAASKAAKKKPAWALTEKDVEEQKEKEIDELLEFAYELDYEKYMDDFEVRQALAIIKDRISEIKKDEDWKQNIAKEWNQAAELELQHNAVEKAESAVSYHSARTGMSKKSLRQQVEEAVREDKDKGEWDPSVKSDINKKMTTEDRIAQKLANEVLKDNVKLRGIHSTHSIKKILENEAKKQLLAEYKGPLVSVIKDKEINKDGLDPSYLPYLHKNPAI